MKNRLNINGYIAVYHPGHPRGFKTGDLDGYVYEHVLVAEKAVGRFLRKGEEVHHLDFNRSNNVKKNLLVLTKSQHVKLHKWLSRGAPIGTTRISLKSEVQDVVQGKLRVSIEHTCKACGTSIVSGSKHKFCSTKCSSKSQRRPIDEQLLARMIKKGRPWTRIGKKLGISDKASKKTAKRLGLIP